MNMLRNIPGDIAALICLEAAYIQLTRGIFLMNHSPRVRTEVPNHDDMKIPTKNMKVMEVINPRPVDCPNQFSIMYDYISYKQHKEMKM